MLKMREQKWIWQLNFSFQLRFHCKLDPKYARMWSLRLGWYKSIMIDQWNIRDPFLSTEWKVEGIFVSARETNVLAQVVRKVDNAIQLINHFPADSVVCFVNTYPLDSVIHLLNNWGLLGIHTRSIDLIHNKMFSILSELAKRFLDTFWAKHEGFLSLSEQSPVYTLRDARGNYRYHFCQERVRIARKRLSRSCLSMSC